MARIPLTLVQLYPSSQLDFFAVRNKKKLECTGSKFNTPTPCFDTIDSTRKVRNKLKQVFVIQQKFGHYWFYFII